MSDQEEKQTDAQLDPEHDGRSVVVPITGSAVENAAASAHAHVSLPSTDGTVTNEPQPTCVPAALAMGIMMLLWGILTNWIMSAAGALVMVWAITGWVREMHEP